jgi:hypothetical protein
MEMLIVDGSDKVRSSKFIKFPPVFFLFLPLTAEPSCLADRRVHAKIQGFSQALQRVDPSQLGFHESQL